MIERTPYRAVFDTNVIIAALLSKNPRSPTRELLRRWENGDFTLLYCGDLLLEYGEKFIDRNIDSTLGIGLTISLFNLGERVELTTEQIKPVVKDDPDDDLVVACAVIGLATHLVTYDPHILSLGEMYQGIRILNGLHFLYVVRGDTLPSSKV